MSIFSFLFGKKRIPQIEQFPEAVIIFSENFEILEYNTYANRLLELTKKTDEQCRPENLFDCDFEILKKELLQENNICTLKIKNSDMFVEIKASQKDPEKIYFSMRDVTQKHKTVTSFMTEYETSKKINRTKNNLLIKLSNEFLSPLHSITGFSQAMIEGLSGEINDKQRKYLNVINKNAADLLDFLDKLIEGAKLETNSYEFNPKMFDVIDATNSMLNEIKAHNPNIKIYTDFSRLGKRGIYSDDTVYKKIIFYMITNLTKSRDYSEIFVELENPDIEYLKKNGISIEENEPSKSFLHVQIKSNEDYVKAENELSKFEIYPQLEINAKRDVINNLPLYNASLFGKYLKIKLSAKTEDKFGFDILLSTEKP